MDNAKKSEAINPSLIHDEKSLEAVLEKMGFISRPVPPEYNVIRRDGKLVGQLQRLLLSDDNVKFESQAVVSIEDNSSLCVYYFQTEKGLFEIWEEFKEEVEIEEIRKSILSAVTLKEIVLRFHFFWPERIQTSEGLELILEDIGFRSYETPWPKGLPASGESSSAPHRLILGNDHNLDRDVLVSVEQVFVHVYYADGGSGIFHEYVKLSGEGNYSIFTVPADPYGNEYKNIKLANIKDSALHEAITNAMTKGKE